MVAPGSQLRACSRSPLALLRPTPQRSSTSPLQRPRHGGTWKCGDGADGVLQHVHDEHGVDIGVGSAEGLEPGLGASNELGEPSGPLAVQPAALHGEDGGGGALDAVSHREREPRRHHAGRHRRAVGVELERGFVPPGLGAVCPELPAHLRLRASEPEHERLLLRRQPVTAVV